MDIGFGKGTWRSAGGAGARSIGVNVQGLGVRGFWGSGSGYDPFKGPG